MNLCRCWQVGYKKKEKINMIKIPLISIVIPTRNRQQYLLKTIETMLRFQNDNFEIIVQDNSDEPMSSLQLGCVLEDSRIIYNYCKEELSFSENFDRAVCCAKGDYVCAIGDDDCVYSSIFEVTQWMKKNNIEALYPTIRSQYYWDGVKYEGYSKGQVTFSSKSHSLTLKKYNVKSEFEQFLKDGTLCYYRYGLPRVYNGIVSNASLLRVRSLGGKVFSGLVPDMYGVTTLSAVIEEVYLLDFPIILSGICRQSGSSDAITGKHLGSLDKSPHFRGNSSYKWSDKIPCFYSPETIWAETLVAALVDLKDEKSLNLINIEAFCANCIIKYGKYTPEIMICLNAYWKNIGKSSFRGKASIFRYTVFQLMKFTIYFRDDIKKYLEKKLYKERSFLISIPYKKFRNIMEHPKYVDIADIGIALDMAVNYFSQTCPPFCEIEENIEKLGVIKGNSI